MRAEKTKPTAGLKSRLEAALHLAAILKGKPFNPIGADRIADSRDRALANRIVTTALRRHGQISHVLGEMLKKGVPSRSGPLEAVLRISIAQLLFMDEIPAHSALNLAVEVARRDKRSGRFDRLVNGVLRQIEREKDRFAALDPALLFPQWLLTRWQKAYGSAALERFAQALIEGAPLDLTLKSPDADLVAQLGATPVLGNSVRLTAREHTVTDLPGFAQGHWWVQDVAATLAAQLIDPATHRNVLDLCAAPGGKTAQLAAAGINVTALDNSAERMERLTANLRRLGLSAQQVVGDALEWRPDTLFDAIVLDAPCSATGTFRRHPEMIWQRNAEGIAQRVDVQRAMLAHALGLLRPGGVLVYCVCSLEPQEGEEQIAWALERFPDIALDPVRPAELDGWSDPITQTGTLRTHPGMAIPGEASGALDGFFVGRLAKKSGTGQ